MKMIVSTAAERERKRPANPFVQNASSVLKQYRLSRGDEQIVMKNWWRTKMNINNNNKITVKRSFPYNNFFSLEPIVDARVY